MTPHFPFITASGIDRVVRHRAEAQVPDGPLTSYALAMPEEYVPRLCPNPAQSFVEAVCVAAYRAYYRAEKRGYWRQPRDPAKPSVWVPAKWTKHIEVEICLHRISERIESCAGFRR